MNYKKIDFDNYSSIEVENNLKLLLAYIMKSIREYEISSDYDPVIDEATYAFRLKQIDPELKKSIREELKRYNEYTSEEDAGYIVRFIDPNSYIAKIYSIENSDNTNCILLLTFED